MKAAFVEKYGGPELLQYGELPDPVASPEEVVLDIVAASVNAADWKARLGEYKHTKLPLIPGRDFSGVVSTAGEGVKDMAVGDEVFLSDLPLALRGLISIDFRVAALVDGIVHHTEKR